MSCDNPDCFGSHHTPEQITRKILRHIRDYGWTVIGVMGRPGFAYTVGLTAKKMPELYVELPDGVDAEGASDVQAMLNEVATHLLNQKLAHHDVLLDQVITFTDARGAERTLVLSRRLHTATMAKARQIYGSKFTAVQVTLMA